MIALRVAPSAIAAPQPGVAHAALAPRLSPLDPAAAVHRATQAMSPRIPPAPDPRRRPGRGVLGWIVDLLIEGFAAYGASLQPGLSSHSVPTTLHAGK
jgi:hypothetical protein